MKVPDNVSRSQLTEAIDEWVVGTNAERNRRLLKRRYIDGVRLEPLAEKADTLLKEINAHLEEQDRKLADIFKELKNENNSKT